MISVIKNIVVIAVLLLVAGLGYYLYTQNVGSSLNTSNGQISSKITAAETSLFLRRLNELKGIELNRDLFTDARFTTLTDFSSDPEPSEIGKENPF